MRIQDPKEIEVLSTDRAFEQLLDQLQIPDTLRPKLTSLDAPVKAAMLRSSHVLSPQEHTSAPSKRPKLRRSLSSNHIDFSNKSLIVPDISTLPSSEGPNLSPPMAPFMKEATSRPSSPFGRSHSRGVSMDIPRVASQSFNVSKSNPKPSKGTVKDISPVSMYMMLSETSSLQLDIETVKKLRILLRNESASWSEGFLNHGGYTALLTRLIEILEVEWRDKKPGDLSTRQLIIDLLQILYEIYPNSSVASKKPIKRSHEFLESSLAPAPVGEVMLPSPHLTVFSFLRTLLLTPAPPPAEASSIPISPHEFIASLHTPRIYKIYLKELSDVCRDYFWIFCHPHNAIWNLEQTDERKVERPKAPGGMTGGVEFEAMTYLTSHFQFINSLTRAAESLNVPVENELSARRFHADLFASGLERIILTARKASTTYYAMLHLEIARYLTAAKQSGYELPWSLVRHIGVPPSHFCLPGVASRNRTPQGSPSKPKAHGPPKIPTPPRAGVLRLE
ncbi:hypothetical protein Clacol_002604 [Clathrus columnatus]|uniref:Formin GTPase-binding domain-containing protein n=1 Tax=Clathrus columnatus TaxID=1419009 RepID=A0AAV5A573_9AGAM|nr:hypothetical protein Clacol_002604 [Clathrus columnatus]